MPPPQLSVNIPTDSITQGEIVQISVDSDQPVTIYAMLDDLTINLVEVALGEYWAIAGVHPLHPPGTKFVDFRVVDDFGRETFISSEFEIISGDYYSETIQLAPEVSALLDPEKVRVELDKLHNIWQQFTPQRLWNDVWVVPGGIDSTSAYGTRRSYGDGPASSYHAGQDFRAATGSRVMASASGIVALAESLHVRGNTVWINHGLGVYSGYFHLSEILVEVGQQVEREELIGRVGNTGLSTGPHIHWEVRVNGIAVNPLIFTRREIMPNIPLEHDQINHANISK